MAQDLGSSILSKAVETGRFGAPRAISEVHISGTGDLIIGRGTTPQNQGIIYCLNQGLQTLWQQAFDQALVTNIGLSRNGATIVVGAGNNQIIFFDRQSRLLWKQPTRSPMLHSTLSTNGAFLVAATEDSNLLFFDMNRASNKFAWRKKFDAPITGVATDEGGLNLIGIGLNGDAICFEPGGEARWTKNHGAALRAVTVSPEGDYALVGGDDRLATLYKANSGQVLWQVQLGGAATSLALTTRAALSVVAANDRGVYAIARDGTVQWRFPLPGVPTRIVASASGTVIAIACDDKSLTLLDDKGGLVWRFQGDSPVHDIAITNDGNQLVAASDAGLHMFVMMNVLYGLFPFSERQIRESQEPGRAVSIPLTLHNEAVAAYTQRDFLTLAAKLRAAEAALIPGLPVVAVPYSPPAPQSAPATSAALPTPQPPVGAAAPTAPPPLPPTPASDFDAPGALARLTDRLEQLTELDVDLGEVIVDVGTLEDLIGEGKTAEAEAMVMAIDERLAALLDKEVKEVLKAVQTLRTEAQALGIQVDETTKLLVGVQKSFRAGEYHEALASARTCQEWLTARIEAAQKAAAAPPAPPAPRPVAPAPAPAPTLAAAPLRSAPAAPAPAPRPAAAPPSPAPTSSGVLRDVYSALQPIEEAIAAGRQADAIRGMVKAIEHLNGVVDKQVGTAVDEAGASVAQLQAMGVDVSGISQEHLQAKERRARGDHAGALSAAAGVGTKATHLRDEAITRALASSKHRLEVALRIGAEVEAAQGLVRMAEESLAAKDHANALRLARQSEEELRKSKTTALTSLLGQAEQQHQQAHQLGLPMAALTLSIGKAKEAVRGATSTGAPADYERAHELVTKALREGEELPKAQVHSALAALRAPMLNAERLGADTMRAKELSSQARAAMATGDLAAALRAAQEAKKAATEAPALHLRGQLEGVRKQLQEAKARGSPIPTAEEQLGAAASALEGGQYERVQELLGSVQSTIEASEKGRRAAVDAIYNAIQRIDEARASGVDVASADTLVNKAIAAKDKGDPTTAKTLADQAIAVLPP